MAVVSRRQFLGGVAGAAVVGTAGCTITRERGPGGMSSGAAVSGSVGTGYAYDEPAFTEADADYVVRNADDLLSAVDNGTADDPPIVYMPGDAAIDLSGRDKVLENVVLASNRSKGTPGAIVYSNTQGADSPAYRGGNGDGVLTAEDNVRLVGFRYRGPTSAVYDSEWYPGYIPQPSGSESERDAFYSSQQARGLTILGDPVQVDNMDIFGWPTQGIAVGAGLSVTPRPQINNSSVTNCGLTSMGYGIEVLSGHPTVYEVYFNGTRHAVAGFGWPNCGYSLVQCEFGPANSLFPVDQHGLRENIDGTSDRSSQEWRYRAGSLMEVIGCTFTSTHVVEFANFSGGDPTPAIVIGGVPKEGVVVQGNTFAHPPLQGNPETQDSSSNPVMSQGPIPPGVETGANGFAKFDISENDYGMTFDYPVGYG